MPRTVEKYSQSRSLSIASFNKHVLHTFGAMKKHHPKKQLPIAKHLTM